MRGRRQARQSNVRVSKSGRHVVEASEVFGRQESGPDAEHAVSRDRMHRKPGEA